MRLFLSVQESATVTASKVMQQYKWHQSSNKYQDAIDLELHSLLHVVCVVHNF